MGPEFGVERVSVGPHTLKEGNKRGDWMKQWLMIQNFAALNTMYRKTEKQATHRTPTGVEKQLAYKLVDREHMCCSRDAEANDMIHMGSDQRSVKAQFCGYSIEERSLTKKHSEKKKIPTAQSTKCQDDEQRKIKHEAETGSYCTEAEND